MLSTAHQKPVEKNIVIVHEAGYRGAQEAVVTGGGGGGLGMKGGQVPHGWSLAYEQYDVQH